MRRTIKPFIVEVRSRGRKPSQARPERSEQPTVEWPTALIEELRAEPQPDTKRMGRVLPVLGEAPRPPVERRPAVEAERGEPIAPDRQAEPEHAEPLPEIAPVVKRRAHLSRADFSRADRWKARLPAAVHRAGKKRR